MKAVMCHVYGSPDDLTYEDVEKPVAGDNEVLIKVHAASVNPLDWHMKRGTLLMRLMSGLRRPKNPRLGVDMAGQVEAIGKNVTQFKPGDEVFGSCQGAFAEYACAPVSSLVLKPENVSFEHAAAVPVVAYTALQGLRDKARLQPGQKILINGASGGVGTMAVQIAKWLGAEVTAVCSGKNADLVRSIGADRVIDYSKENFTQSGYQYDVIFDLVSNQSLTACRRVLNPKGIYIGAGVLSSHATSRILLDMLKLILMSWFAKQRLISFMARRSREELAIIGDLMKSGKVKAVIDRRYKLSEVPEAIKYLETGRVRGKLVITIA